MIEPYQAVGLIQTMRGIRRREEIQVNLEHISHMIKAASWLSSCAIARLSAGCAMASDSEALRKCNCRATSRKYTRCRSSKGY